LSYEGNILIRYCVKVKFILLEDYWMEFPNKNLEKKNAIWLFTKAKKCSYGSIERILLVLERSAKVVANHSL